MFFCYCFFESYIVLIAAISISLIRKHNFAKFRAFTSLIHLRNGRKIIRIFNKDKIKSWQQHPTRHQLYGHLPPITKSIQVRRTRRTRHAGHCWRSRDELIRDVLLWIPTHGRAKAGRPARTYIQQLCEDTGCCPEDLPRAMNDREEWRERVRDIRAASTIWWWWAVNKYVQAYQWHGFPWLPFYPSPSPSLSPSPSESIGHRF